MKRNGKIVDFDERKIYHAIQKAIDASSEKQHIEMETLMNSIILALEQGYGHDAIPTVEEIQEVVESVLISR